MSGPDSQIAHSLTREERKQLLILACEADRAAWRETCRPRPRPPAATAAHLLRLFEPLFPFIPGLPGRLLQKVSSVARLLRQFGLFTSIARM